MNPIVVGLMPGFSELGKKYGQCFGVVAHCGMCIVVIFISLAGCEQILPLHSGSEWTMSSTEAISRLWRNAQNVIISSAIVLFAHFKYLLLF